MLFAIHHSLKNQFRDVHYFQVEFLPSHLGFDGSHTLLAGRDRIVGAGPLNLLDLPLGYSAGEIGAFHFHVAPATATHTVRSVALQLNNLDPRNRAQNSSRRFISTVSALIARITVRHCGAHLFEGYGPILDQLLIEFSAVQEF
jgi:hypothetical protein